MIECFYKLLNRPFRFIIFGVDDITLFVLSTTLVTLLSYYYYGIELPREADFSNNFPGYLISDLGVLFALVSVLT